MKLFLTSSVHAVAHDIAERVNLSTADKLVFIDTAAEMSEGDKTWLEDDKQALIKAGFKVSSYTITGKTLNQLETDLRGYDYIYLSGGHAAYLLKQSQESGFFELIKKLVRDENKVYIGTSAGSIIAGPKLPDYYSDEVEELKLGNIEGYGFVNFTVVPHWGSEHFKERYLGKRLTIVYKDTQVPLILLTDNQYVQVVEDRFNIVDLSNL